jgi:SAM-dependent methyltransferase
MQPLAELYDASFFELLRDGTRKSASVVVPLLIDFFRPRSVVDIGCGAGLWLAAFRECGVTDVLGVDGAWVPATEREIPEELFLERDLAQPLSLDRTFDLVLCLETAEHLPHEAAVPFVESLTRVAPIIVFSAAIPRQGGTGHFNEQWPSYWAKLFASCGYECLDLLRDHLWANDAVEAWYRQNMLCFVARDRPDLRASLANAGSVARPLDIVHPGIFLPRPDPLRHRLEHLEDKLRQCRDELTSIEYKLRQCRDELTSIKESRSWRFLEAVRPALNAAKWVSSRLRFKG